MALIAELSTMLSEREAHLLTERNNALVFLKVERVASILRDAGIQLTVENIASFGFLEPKEVENVINWMERGSKTKVLPFELNSQSEPKSVLDRVKAGLLWIESRSKGKRGDKPLPPADAQLVGVQRVMQLTGLGRVEILQAVQDHEADIKAVFPDFRPAWVNDTKEIIQKNAKNQHPETKIRLIKQAVEELSGGMIGAVSGEQIARWKNGAIGLSRVQIDNLLSNHPELRNLDKHRAAGSRYRETLADREASYRRKLNSGV